MAFIRANLQLVGPSGGNAPHIWSYASTDAAATVGADDYFVTPVDMSTVFNAGDQIHQIDPATGGVDAPLTLTTASVFIVTNIVRGVGGVTGQVDTIINAWTIT